VCGILSCDHAIVARHALESVKKNPHPRWRGQFWIASRIAASHRGFETTSMKQYSRP
jgi:hypothetical protein